MMKEDHIYWVFNIISHTVGDWTCPLHITAFCFKVTLEDQNLVLYNSLLNELRRRVAGNTVGTDDICYACHHIN
jgi:hypothetical protein